ncbi:hypothetical protein [Nannocystis radixulma]|uniref:hypothetical protein n=1 Tax=Nannocystis radixulma TaxID=2995305 RepID=UPI00232C1237|nr:hypothetical protein [Nannocystis radixulma]
MLVASFELTIPPHVAVDRVASHFQSGGSGEWSFSVGPRPGQFHLERSYYDSDRLVVRKVLAHVRSEGEGCSLTLAADHGPEPDGTRLLAGLSVAGGLFAVMLSLLGVAPAPITGLMWIVFGPGLLGGFSSAEESAAAAPRADDRERELVAVLGRLFADVRRSGGYRALAPAEPEAELVSSNPAVRSTALVLSPGDAVAHAAARLRDDRSGAIVVHPRFDPCCFLVERRRLPGERGGSSWIEVVAHGEEAGCRVELHPHRPETWVRSSVALLAFLGLLSLIWGPALLHLFPVLALCVLYWQAEERERWLQLVERDRAELEAAVMQAFASARRPE